MRQLSWYFITQCTWKGISKYSSGRLKQSVEPLLLEAQCGFHPGRGTIYQIWLVRQLIEKSIEHECAVHICFVDLEKAFDSIPREILRLLLKERGIEEQVVQLIVDIHDGTRGIVKSSGEKSSKFEVTTGVRQGCAMSPVLFNLVMDKIVCEALNKAKVGGVEIEYRKEGSLYMNYRVKAQGTSVIKAAMYADDLALIGKTPGELQKLVDSLHESCCKWGMKISIKKTKVLSIGYEHGLILLDGSVLENVTEFTYLGSIMSQDGGCIAEIDARISKASKVFGFWKKRVFTNR